MYDLKNWFLMPSVSAGYKLPNGTPYGRETHHLEGLHLENNSKVYAYHYDTGKTMVFMKTPAGWPWDLKPYDAADAPGKPALIYDWATENGWKSDKDFKQQVTPLPMVPRFWDGNPTEYEESPHVAYGVFSGGQQVGHGDVGPAFFTIAGPFLMDHKGDVGSVQTILVSYFWSDRKNREQLFLTMQAGWVTWTHANLVQLPGSVDSDYVIDATTVHNHIVGGTVKPVSTALAIP